MEDKERLRILEQIKNYFLKDSRAGLTEEIMESIEMLQRESYLEGYCYAIAVLQEGLVKEKERE